MAAANIDAALQMWSWIEGDAVWLWDIQYTRCSGPAAGQVRWT